MKRTTKIIAAGVLGTALVGGLAMAHGFGRDGSGYMASRLADRLDLDPAQQTQVEAALEARQAAMQALREQIREERRRLADIVRDGSDPEAVAAASERVSSLMTQMMTMAGSFKRDLDTVLTTEQRAELDRHIARRLEGGGWGRHGGGHHGGRHQGYWH